jgi:hypothetical protein
MTLGQTCTATGPSSRLRYCSKNENSTHSDLESIVSPSQNYPGAPYAHRRARLACLLRRRGRFGGYPLAQHVDDSLRAGRECVDLVKGAAEFGRRW